MAMPSNVLEIRYSKIYNNLIKKDIKILSLADIHISDLVKEKEIDFIIETVKKEKPDYICTLGDIIDYPRVLNDENNREKCKKLYESLSLLAPVFIIFGNHDYINYDIKDLYNENYNKEFWDELDKNKNINIINDKKIELEDLIISGYFEKRNIYHGKYKEEFFNDFQSIKELKLENNNKPSLLLIHSPEPLDSKKNIDLVKHYNLILCGHYHNGCVPSFLNKVFLPKHSGIIKPSKKIFPKNVRGIRKIDKDTYLIYNGGWTKIASNTPKKIHKLDNLCNRQIDVTILSNKIKKDITIKTKKIKIK